MDDLIARLKAAAGGSREFDAEIKCLVLGSCGCAATCSRRYTTSLDAAWTLIPAGWAIYEMGETMPRGGHWYVRACPRDGSWGPADSAAPTPALAIVIAALSARTRAKPVRQD